jgi:mono/diheme cytochrome c family protein
MDRIAAARAAVCALLVALGETAAGPDDARAVMPGSDAPIGGVEAELGAELFVRYCASCHGTDGRGDGPVADAMRVPPSDLTRIAARRDGAFAESEIWGFIDGRLQLAAHGSREMPVWGARWAERIPEPGVSDEIVRGKIVVLVEYLKSIQGPE